MKHSQKKYSLTNYLAQLDTLSRNSTAFLIPTQPPFLSLALLSTEIKTITTEREGGRVRFVSMDGGGEASAEAEISFLCLFWGQKKRCDGADTRGISDAWKGVQKHV